MEWEFRGWYFEFSGRVKEFGFLFLCVIRYVTVVFLFLVLILSFSLAWRRKGMRDRYTFVEIFFCNCCFKVLFSNFISCL